MPRDWTDDLSKSAATLLNVVWPKIKDECGSGELLPVEGVTDSTMARNLDKLAGIDAWQLFNNKKGMRGLASRIQWAPKQSKINASLLPWQPYASFTIRKHRTTGAETEWTKRKRALDNIKSGVIFPGLTIQAYVDVPRTGNLLYACAVRTSDLFEFATEGFIGTAWESKINPDDGNEFAIFWVDWLQTLGVNVKEYIAPAVRPRRPARRAA